VPSARRGRTRAPRQAARCMRTEHPPAQSWRIARPWGRVTERKNGTDPGASVRRLTARVAFLVRTVTPLTWPAVSRVAARGEQASAFGADLLPILYRQVRSL